MSFSKMDWRKT